MACVIALFLDVTVWQISLARQIASSRRRDAWRRRPQLSSGGFG
jgi:hypothetical protein